MSSQSLARSAPSTCRREHKRRVQAATARPGNKAQRWGDTVQLSHCHQHHDHFQSLSPSVKESLQGLLGGIVENSPMGTTISAVPLGPEGPDRRREVVQRAQCWPALAGRWQERVVPRATPCCALSPGRHRAAYTGLRAPKPWEGERAVRLRGRCWRSPGERSVVQRVPLRGVGDKNKRKKETKERNMEGSKSRRRSISLSKKFK